MALYELAISAGKYGALPDRKGEVAIGWDIEAGSGDDSQFSMSWVEPAGRR